MQVTPDNLDKVLFPLCRTEHRSFWRDQPAGERQGCRSFSEGQEPLPKTLGKSEERRIKAASGSPFLWILSFGDAKESIAAVGPRTDIKIKPSRQRQQPNQVAGCHSTYHSRSHAARGNQEKKPKRDKVHQIGS
jgi:hypothetical protein